MIISKKKLDSLIYEKNWWKQECEAKNKQVHYLIDRIEELEKVLLSERQDC